MLIDIDGTGEVEARATLYTLVVYENEFHSDLIRDVFGAGREGGGSTLYVDFNSQNWNAVMKALWAMVKTANVIADRRGDVAPNDRVGSYEEWSLKVGGINIFDILGQVSKELSEGFFRTAPADEDEGGAEAV